MIVWTTNDSKANRHVEFVARRLRETVALAADLMPATATDRTTPQLLPTTATGDGVAALLVPDQLDRHVTRNGVLLSPGAHVLRHTDRLEYGGRTWWIAAKSEAREVHYEADVHGDDVYCFITKARLQVGEGIVVCPGPAGAECGAVYRTAAWEMAQQSNDRFRCPRCGFEPAAAEWQPPQQRQTNLPQLFELARQRRPEGAA